MPWFSLPRLFDARQTQAACEAELAVNAPYAPEIYRGVVAITREASGKLAIGGSGEPVEWAVDEHLGADQNPRLAAMHPLENRPHGAVSARRVAIETCERRLRKEARDGSSMRSVP